MFKRILTLLTAVVLMFSMGVSAYAAVPVHEIPDLTREGSFTITLRYKGKPVPGGTVTIHRVGDVVQDNGDYIFTPTGVFSGCGLSYAEPNAALAASLSDIAKRKNAAGTDMPVDENGQVAFTGLLPGLYLIEQRLPARNYWPFDPFVIGLPTLKDGMYVYDIDASPKLDLTADPIHTLPPGLPQTGQLNWPVPVLAFAGVCFFVLGWFLYYRQRKEEE